MNVQDPVCGMWLDEEQAAANVQCCDVTYYFCADRCRDVFTVEPERYLDGDYGGAQYWRASGADATRTTCPFCGDETGIPRDIAPELTSLSLDEFETLVRNEWRRRLGNRLGESAYRRQHPRAFIRALIVFALRPESPVRDQVVEELLWREVSELEAWGFSRRHIQGELFRLSQAIWEVLSRTNLEFDRSSTLMERIDEKLHTALGWPE